VFVGANQVARFDEEATVPLSESVCAEILRRAREHLDEVDLLVMSDYRKGVLTPSIIAQLSHAAQERQIPIIVDPKGPGFGRYRGATLVTPNAREARIAAGAQPDSEDWISITNRLIQEADVGAVAVTCGAAGIMLRRRQDCEVCHRRTLGQAVFDVIGAGDTVVAAFAVAIGSGLDLVAAADIANVAAGVVVQKRGTSTVSLSELAAVGAYVPVGKVMTIADAVLLADRVRHCGGRVVFSNGCFDLLHAGHVLLLERARVLGDLLIVGLNSDDSVRRLKGPTRPVYPLETRARILASLASVDAVVPFDDPALADLVRRLRPEVLVKGGDYEAGEIVGREYAREVVTVPILDGQSTTNTLLRILRGSRELGAEVSASPNESSS
jgi:D-beta-D-heptose 7-phosphate kinase/D-beta-D-heptose 1-phosphate adenosyltransferase